MEQSILNSIKKLLGISEDDTSFDQDILTFINSAFSIINDLGVGPEGGFVIEDDTAEWADYFSGAPEDPEDPDNKVKLSKIKTIVQLRVRLLFDPPTLPHLLESTKAQLQEHEWRLNVNREAYAWVDPNPPVIEETDVFT